jgi:hypothetical protein
VLELDYWWTFLVLFCMRACLFCSYLLEIGDKGGVRGDEIRGWKEQRKIMGKGEREADMQRLPCNTDGVGVWMMDAINTLLTNLSLSLCVYMCVSSCSFSFCVRLLLVSSLHLFEGGGQKSRKKDKLEEFVSRWMQGRRRGLLHLISQPFPSP